MTSSKEFTRQELEALEPWVFPEVDGESVVGGRVIDEEIDDTPVLTAEEIEAMQRQAYEEAAELGRKEGHEQGYRDGYRLGEQAGQEATELALKEKAAQLDRVLRGLEQPLCDLDQAVEEELIALAMAVARQLVRRELKADPGQIIAVVREAMAVLPSSARNIKLFLHPDDAALVRATLALGDAASHWTIVEEPLLSRGGCRVITETSRIDASVEKRLNAAIATAMGGERSEDVSNEPEPD